MRRTILSADRPPAGAWRRRVGMMLASLGLIVAATGPAWSVSEKPVPLLSKGGAPVDWWFAFKFSSQKTFAGCGKESRSDESKRACIFGGKVQAKERFGQQFAFASSSGKTLSEGKGCVGATTTDPIGATFDQVYNGNFNYVIWNDQFYGDPVRSRVAPWAHSKGLLAWNDAGEGFVMQVSTPSWPGSGTSRIKRKAGNTLGCVSSNNNLLASQHFFALKLDKSDLIKVLTALKRAGVVTDPTKLQIVRNGGPEDVQGLVNELGKLPAKLKLAPGEQAPQEAYFTKDELSSNVVLIAKTSNLTAPPWQVVSALLDGSAGRTATWWLTPRIYTTTKVSKIGCLKPWIEPKKGEPMLKTTPGAVSIALTGTWKDQEIKLNATTNHAKFGVATSGSHHYVIFGDLNQQGTVSPPDCGKSQNGRGGLFFVLDNKALADSVTDLVEGDTALTRGKP
ncbi:MAG: hypothetical protein JWR80_4724 [Bradyrhizobium sp.]|nr:hypothetical protein [Bradyrhizobium sp.]